MDMQTRQMIEKLVKEVCNTIAGVTFIVCLAWVVATVISR